MKHFYRAGVTPAEAIHMADSFFAELGMAASGSEPRSRKFSGALGSLTVSVRSEGGHYTFVEVSTDQTGESRLDRNVKKYFLQLHRKLDPRHTLEAVY